MFFLLNLTRFKRLSTSDSVQSMHFQGKEPCIQHNQPGRTDVRRNRIFLLNLLVILALTACSTTVETAPGKGTMISIRLSHRRSEFPFSDTPISTLLI